MGVAVGQGVGSTMSAIVGVTEYECVIGCMNAIVGVAVDDSLGVDKSLMVLVTER